MPFCSLYIVYLFRAAHFQPTKNRYGSTWTAIYRFADKRSARDALRCWVLVLADGLLASSTCACYRLPKRDGHRSTWRAAVQVRVEEGSERRSKGCTARKSTTLHTQWSYQSSWREGGRRGWRCGRRQARCRGFFYLEPLFPLTNGTSGNLKFCEGKIEKTIQVFFFDKSGFLFKLIPHLTPRRNYFGI
jgi:hypothetical protein